MIFTKIFLRSNSGYEYPRTKKMLIKRAQLNPAFKKEYKGTFDLIIIPELVFDNNNYRLGYGGGYYDNFLAKHPIAYKLGIFYPNQKVDKAPIETHDLQLNEILLNLDL